MIQVITISIILALVAADQIIKLLVIKYLEPIGTLPLIDGFVRFNYTENTGAAFGSFSKYTTILSIITFAVLVVGIVLLLLNKIKNKVEYFCAVVIIAGGIGNLIDRVFRGYVIDFIEPLFINFAIFNFADMLITCGATVLIIWMIVDIFLDSKKKKVKNNE